jgi:hypothetical protein
MQTMDEPAYPPPLPPAPPVGVDRAWHEKPVVRGLGAAALVLGLVLIGVGIWGFVAASSADHDADTAEAQAAEVRDEAASLDAEREQALADASSASDQADALSRASVQVRTAAQELRTLYSEATDASNALVSCDASASEAVFLACAHDALSEFQAKSDELQGATDDLRQAMDDLQEGLG